VIPHGPSTWSPKSSQRAGIDSARREQSEVPNSGDIITELEHGGKSIDVLVNNAGYYIHAPVEAFTEDEARAQMETMYFGPCGLFVQFCRICVGGNPVLLLI
jgi:NAD(P)-dependent dehydrogenase (short-subunit alcohol dehydrogenase family)